MRAPYKCPECGKYIKDWYGYWACFCSYLPTPHGAICEEVERRSKPPTSHAVLGTTTHQTPTTHFHPPPKGGRGWV